MLTKPDTLQSGTEQIWLDVVEGRTHPRKLGYYVTKQPSMAELIAGIDHETGRRNEEHFFANTYPWRDADFRTKQRLGVARLTDQLSKLLSGLIQNL